MQWMTLPYGQHPPIEYGGELVALAFQDAGFEPPVDDDEWDVLFTHQSMVRELAKAGEPAKVPLPQRPRRRTANHCGYFAAAGNKCLFAEHVQAVEQAHGRNWTTGQRRHLLTFKLRSPQQAQAWARAARADPTGHWVVKDCSGGNAERVHIVAGTDEAAIDAAMGTQAVAQEYVQGLLVFGNSKWHARLYVLVTSWAPTRVFLFQQGMVQVGSRGYDPSKPSQADLFSDGLDVHALDMLWAALGLRRAAIAKGKVKSTLAELFGAAVRRSFGDFGRMASGRSFHCFDLFALDVPFGEDLTPYVLEVNQGPNLWGDNKDLQWAVKGSLTKQVAAWAARRARHRGPLLVEEEEAIENTTLTTFVRIV